MTMRGTMVTSEEQAPTGDYGASGALGAAARRG